MTNSYNILITGSTGHLGRNIYKFLAEKTNYKLFLLIRGRSNREVQSKYKKLVQSLFVDPVIRKKAKKSTEVVPGDVESLNLGLSKKTLNELRLKINEVYHCAAITGFNLTVDLARKVNVYGTSNILDFSSSCKNFKRANHISTMFVLGNKDIDFSENTELSAQANFNNSYEQSKFEAECLISKYRKNGLKVSIFRPSIIVGEYESGLTTNFKMFYEPLHFLSKEIFKRIPADYQTQHNIVPVDVAAKSICALAINNPEEEIYHIISSENSSLGSFMDLAACYFGFKNPKFIPSSRFDFSELTPVQKKILTPFIPYFNFKTRFKSNQTELMLKSYGFSYPRIDEIFFKKIFKFCNISGFIKRRRKY